MRQHPFCNRRDHLISRRQILGATVAGAAAGTGLLDHFLSPVCAESLNENERQVIFIWLDGGISQLESWDPKPNTQFGGPFRAIPSSVTGVHLSELLSQTSKQMHHLAIVRSMHTQDNSHSAGVPRINRGDPNDRGVVYPYFGSAVAKLLGPTKSALPPYVWIKPYSGGFKSAHAGFLGARYGALAFGDGKPPENLLRPESLPEEDAAWREELRQRFDARYAKNRRPDSTDANSYVFDTAQKLMQRHELFDESKIDARDRQRYGEHELGRHLLLGRRMLEAGVRFVNVTSYHWDSHGDNFNASQSLIPQFDQPFAALIDDLDQRSMLDNVLVIAMSEFGRTPKINSHVGRDHWPEAWSVAMAGCGIQNGAVIGKTNELGTENVGDEYDVGHLFHTWFRALGLREEDAQYDNNSQPLPAANENCSAIKQLLT